jgi:penicillin amidase
MKLKKNTVVLDGHTGKINIRRNNHGIPVIKAENVIDLAFGQGWIHACDRQLQAMLTKTLLTGRAAEQLKGDPELIEIDKFMRSMNFLHDADEEIEKLNSRTKGWLQAYADGFNAYMSSHKPVHEFKLIGYVPEPWRIEDCMIIGKVFGYIGLADAQGSMEKLLIQMIQNNLSLEKVRELFPYLTEEIDYDLIQQITLSPPLVPESVRWLGKLPSFAASNNWVVAGNLTASGNPILCGDPHLEVNRLPAIWQEIVMVLPDNRFTGVSIPGIPGMALGRTKHIAWSATFAFMDMIDYRIEHCRDGKYERKNGWEEFQVREEIINVKKGPPVTLTVYENEHGLLEGDPHQEGYYLVHCWSAKSGCGADDFNALLEIQNAESVSEAMSLFKRFDCAPFNWVIADTDGNIGYQMSGRLFNRPDGVSGLVPLPGWEEGYDPDGYVDKDLFPAAFNPDDGMLVTANQDLNHLGRCSPINLPMGAYRAERIFNLLKRTKKISIDHMKGFHFDLYSPQAEKLMQTVRPLLPDTEKGRILKDWNLEYESGSLGATLFESVYRELMMVVFGDNGLGREVMDCLMSETSILNDYYANFDDILMKENSAWFEDKSRESLFRQAIDGGLKITPERYGHTRKIVMTHLLLGGQVPRFLGYDYGPIELPGSRATIPQGQIFKSAGRTTTFSPSYRFITDMGTGEIHSNLAGGPTDRRFSKWYTSDIQSWLKGKYKVLP